MAYRTRALRDLFGAGDLIDSDASRALWSDIACVQFFAAPDDRAIWRISTAPTRGPEFVSRLRRSLDAKCFYDWGGGLVWLATRDNGDAGAAAIRTTLKAFGGHATLVRAAVETRASIDVFEPLSEGAMRLTRGIKAAFDPSGILNPGRMYAGV